MSPKTTPKGENSRQQILEAAYPIFLEKGYHAASVRDISRRAKLTIGGVYTHFDGKEAIFKALLDERNPFFQVVPAILAAEGETVDALIHDAARRMVAALGVNRAALNLLFIEIVEFQGIHLTDLFPQVFPQVIGFVQKIVNCQGDLRPEIPLPVLGRSFFGLFFSYVMTNIILANQMPFDQSTLNQFVDIYLYGILSAVPADRVQTISSSTEVQS